MPEHTFTVTRSGYTMQAKLRRENQDVLIELTGGDVPHYGVVTAVSLHQPLQTIALPSRPGHHHQEGVLTERVATVIAPVLQSNAFIVGGLHVNRISKQQLAVAGAMAQALGEQIRDYLATHPRTRIEEEFS
ncbi:MAG: hypothetical protein LKJ29_06605 [Lactobacillus sp.]|jgi:hypothetical protein|uniref:Prenylated flavin chaperone LpdD-like domain-containing protein n=1 Tax=Lacticaseibacillus suilingensis TaxID=2799577 RepID=A0ABW4BDL3_9LACO|nr:hypothetical protein [Lacticaseibacillus suilingensis]MCI1893788.1 hypothetical protein [Lactobacillus sp.]MCI1918084.1 hypothetical protein [Lactobacillus sp.]MCI1941705.1 hypothetical protein [Lactobacillus sp.]MCI1972251.1 hypothetical protein [Lactobacillus sp.]MCI2016879.1 hypothetical protein [Lactobacillus sp.]